jgi:hypothetical protein
MNRSNNSNATNGNVVLDIVAASQWESPAELMLQLDEARRHIEQLLWQIHDLTEEIGRLEMEIASLEDSN